MKFADKKMSRRKLLGTAATATAALPLLHETVPHQVVHDQVARAAGDEHGAHGGGGVGSQAHKGAGHRGTVGQVNPRVNGFDPHEILRDYERGTIVREGGRTIRQFELVAEDREIEVALGVKFAAWAYNGRVPGPTLRATEGEHVLSRSRLAGRGVSSGLDVELETVVVHTVADGQIKRIEPFLDLE